MPMPTTDDELLEQARQLHDEAHSLLFQGRLLAIVQQVGPTFISGSYSLNLMARRDIDIYVRLARDLDTAAFFELGGALTRQFQVLNASYSNHFVRGFPGFDHGLYWGIQLRYPDQKWKLDLWGYGPPHFDQHCDDFEKLRQSLVSADKAAILRIKNALRVEDGYRNNVISMDIYSAVRSGKVTTEEQFENWMASRL